MSEEEEEGDQVDDDANRPTPSHTPGRHGFLVYD